jgi:hypothetical protein
MPGAIPAPGIFKIHPMKKQMIVASVLGLLACLIALLTLTPQFKTEEKIGKPKLHSNQKREAKTRQPSARSISKSRQDAVLTEVEIRRSKGFKIHLAVKHFLDSPARDSMECRVMLQKLRDNGYGIEYLEPVYKGAWGVRYADPKYNNFLMNGRPATNDSPAVLAFRGARENSEKNALLNGHDVDPINNEDLIHELLNIRPKQPYTNPEDMTPEQQKKRQAIPTIGESFLTEEDLGKYLANNPAREVENYRPESLEDFGKTLRILK